MRRRPKVCRAISLACGAILPAQAVFAQVRYDPIAVPGMPAPGVLGATFGHATDLQFALDDQGRVAFVTSLVGPGVTTSNDHAVYFGPPGSPQLLAREGQTTPGGEGTFGFSAITLSPFDNLSVSPDGRLAFDAYFRQTNPAADTGRAVYTSTGGAIQPVAVTGGPAQGGAGAFVFPGGPRSGTGGHVTFADAGITLYVGPAASPQVLARTGDPTPVAGTTYGSFYGWPTYTKAPSDSGAALFVSSLDGPAVTDASNRAIFFGTPGNVLTVARSGDAAPGIPGGVFAGDPDGDVHVFHPHLSATGRIAFVGQLADDRYVLYGGTPAAPQLIAKTGDAVPGAPGTFHYSGNPIAADDGRVIARAEMRTGPTDFKSGLFTSAPGGDPGLVPFLLEGDPVPGLPDGTIFSDAFDLAWRDERIANHPQFGPIFAFVGGLDGAPVDSSNDFGVFLGSFDGDPILLAREGDPFTLAPGDVRTIAAFGGILSPNSAGQVAFHAYFTDGTQGIFVATVPEPGFAVACASLAGLLFQRRRRR